MWFKCAIEPVRFFSFRIYVFPCSTIILREIKDGLCLPFDFFSLTLQNSRFLKFSLVKYRCQSLKMNSNFSGPKLFTFVLSREHGYAAGVALTSWVALQYMGVNVMKARKR